MDDYDEFGNYIGALSDSDDEDASAYGGGEGGAGAGVGARFGQETSPAPLAGYDDDEEDGMEGDDDGSGAGASSALMRIDESASNAVVLHEDKKYYASAKEVYGEEVEALVQEEDAQPLTQPIVEPVKVRRYNIEEKGLPKTRFERQFMMSLMQFPHMVRNVVVAGHLHHGKTSLLDMLVQQTHVMPIDTDRQVSCCCCCCCCSRCSLVRSPPPATLHA